MSQFAYSDMPEAYCGGFRFAAKKAGPPSAIEGLLQTYSVEKLNMLVARRARRKADLSKPLRIDDRDAAKGSSTPKNLATGLLAEFFNTIDRVLPFNFGGVVTALGDCGRSSLSRPCVRGTSEPVDQHHAMSHLR